MDPNALLHSQMAVHNLLYWDSKCIFQPSFLSRNTPKYLAESENCNTLLKNFGPSYTVTLYLFVETTMFVFSAFADSLVPSHHHCMIPNTV